MWFKKEGNAMADKKKTQKKPTKAQIKKEIIRFLDRCAGVVDKSPGQHSCGIEHRNGLVLATSSNDVPRATPLEYFNEGMTLYIIGEPGGKIANLKKNPNVSAAIYEQPMDHSKRQQSLQLFGTAELITVKNNPRLFRTKIAKWEIFDNLQRMYLKRKADGKTLSAAEKKALKDQLESAVHLIKVTPSRAIMREYHPDFSSPRYKWEK